MLNIPYTLNYYFDITFHLEMSIIFYLIFDYIILQHFYRFLVLLENSQLPVRLFP